MRRIRIVDAGDQPWLTAMAIWHGVAHAMDGSTPDTITLCSPTSPFVSVGFHQEVEKEVDLDYCTGNQIPVVRREVGGGAVYLDHGQIFWHTIFHHTRVPGTIEEVYKQFLSGPVAAHQAMGIDACHRPVNDLQVGGKKIGGTGAALIGEAMVVAGSLIMDFHYELMARVLKVPSEKFRDKVYQSLQEYLTTITRELGDRTPSRQEAKAILVREFARALGAEAYYGELTRREWAFIRQAEGWLTDPGWTFRKGSLPKHGVKIHEGVRVLDSAVKLPGGLVRSTVRVRDGVIDDIAISGDFFFYPADALTDLERSLVGLAWDEAVLTARIEAFYRDHAVQAPGLPAAELARAVAAAMQPRS